MSRAAQPVVTGRSWYSAKWNSSVQFWLLILTMRSQWPAAAAVSPLDRKDDALAHIYLLYDEMLSNEPRDGWPMRVQEMEHEGLLELDSNKGVIRFAGQRALLLDAVAMGLLRKYLVENFGVTAARTVLTQFGFAHGWRMAEALRTEYEWDSTEEWRHAGTRIHTLGGLFHLDGVGNDPLAEGGSVLINSYEAEQHLLHLSQSEAPVCWTICGLISGYLSFVAGGEVFVLEDRCVAAGASTCHLRARSRADWGNERADDLAFFESQGLAQCLEISLQRVTSSLKVAEKKLSQHRRTLRRASPDVDEPMGIVAKSSSMLALVDLARRVAKVDSTVLISGESGAGKERVARFVHDQSARADRPFMAVNCGAITETLLESELFGHKRGAFTGATHDRAGMFEAASGGTLLLDEIGDVTPGMQVRLLRVLQEREVRRVGENRSRPVDVRVLAATNRSLAAGVTEGTMRKDLYYRLNVVELHLPSLRERRADILPLARLLLAEAALHAKRAVDSISPAAADALLRYSWPGNVRELENAMERAVALAHGSRVEVEDLPGEVRESPSKPVPDAGLVRPLADIEKDYIIAALDINGGNQTHTAEQLHIGTATLYRKLKAYGMIGNSRRPPSGSTQ